MYRCDDAAGHMVKYLDGLLDNEGNQVFEKHIKECKKCREEFEELQTFLPHMRNTSFPEKVCPDSELLVRFSENDVTFSEGREIKAHLEECLSCREEATLLFELKKEVTPDECTAEIYEKKFMPPSLMSQVKEIYSPLPGPVRKFKPEFNFTKFLPVIFGKKKWVTVLATFSLALFMALNGFFHISPGSMFLNPISVQPEGNMKNSNVYAEGVKDKYVMYESSLTENIQKDVDREFGPGNATVMVFREEKSQYPAPQCVNTSDSETMERVSCEIEEAFSEPQKDENEYKKYHTSAIEDFRISVILDKSLDYYSTETRLKEIISRNSDIKNRGMVNINMDISEKGSDTSEGGLSATGGKPSYCSVFLGITSLILSVMLLFIAAGNILKKS